MRFTDELNAGVSAFKNMLKEAYKDPPWAIACIVLYPITRFRLFLGGLLSLVLVGVFCVFITPIILSLIAEPILWIGNRTLINAYIDLVRPITWIFTAYVVGVLAYRFMTNAMIKNFGYGENDTHGTARLSTFREAANNGHLRRNEEAKKSGIVLGAVPTPVRGYEPYYYQDGHILTCAPTGAGKGVSAVTPNLLSYMGSMVVLDIKGENYAVTGQARRDMGHTVHVIDPYGVTDQAQTDSFNWMDKIDVSQPDCLSHSELLADCVVVSDKNVKNPHFNEMARALVQGVILYVAGTKPKEDHNLGMVRRLLACSSDDFTDLMAEMASHGEGLAFGTPAGIANTILSLAPEELGSIRSTINRHLNFLDDPRVKAVLSNSTFSFDDLKRKKMTVYIVIPQTEIKRNMRLTRTIVASSLGGITNDNIQPQDKVVFLLDEFAQLGTMQALLDGISIVRGYGAAFWLIIQNLQQLRAAYPDSWETFFANSTKHFFGVDDYQTAKYFSDMMGAGTINYRTRGESHGKDHSNSTNEHFSGRPLLTPDEIMNMGKQTCMVLTRGERPHKLMRVVYYEDENFASKAAPNPYYDSGQEGQMKNVTSKRKEEESK